MNKKNAHRSTIESYRIQDAWARHARQKYSGICPSPITTAQVMALLHSISEPVDVRRLSRIMLRPWRDVAAKLREMHADGMIHRDGDGWVAG